MDAPSFSRCRARAAGMKASNRGALALIVLVICTTPACLDTATAPERDALDPLEIPPPSSPENLIRAIEAIYNDEVRKATERVQEYENLLLPSSDDPPRSGFVFRFQPKDIETDPFDIGATIPESWGIADELAAHEQLFSFLENRQVYSLHVEIINSEARDVDPPEVGREGWKEVFASSVNLRVLFNRTDGFEMNGAQAEFKLAPGDGRWFIGEWLDLPRPVGFEPELAIEHATWGRIRTWFRMQP